MTTTSFTYAALKTELTADPVSMGYATPLGRGDWKALESILNNYNSATITKQYMVSAPPMAGALLTLAIDAKDLVNMTALDVEKFKLYACMSTVDLSVSNTISALATIFPANSKTMANISGLALRSGSRIEYLFGASAVFYVTPDGRIPAETIAKGAQ